MNTKNIVIGVLVVLVLVFGILYYQAQLELANIGGAGIGPTQHMKWNFIQGLFVQKGFDLNGLESQVVAGTFVNATTTFVSFKTPYTSGTSTIDLAQVLNTGVATSTYVMTCGVSYSNYGSPTTALLTSGDIATSTSFGLMVNNEANSFPVSGGSAARVRIGPAQYFLCYATTYAVVATHDGAFTGNMNTFDGTYKVRFVK